MKASGKTGSLFSGTLFFLLFLAGCGPFYRTVVVMAPVGTGEYEIDSGTGICKIEKAGVKFTLSFQKRKELEAISPYPAWNPYLNEQKIFYSVFKLVVENTRQDKISVDMSKAVLLDGLGNQESALMTEYFKGIYPESTKVQQQRGLRGFDYSEIVIYTEDYYRYNAAERTIFKAREVFPEVKMEGYLVFNIVRREAGSVTVVLPGVKLLGAKCEEEGKTEELRFKFVHSVSVKESTADDKR